MVPSFKHRLGPTLWLRLHKWLQFLGLLFSTNALLIALYSSEFHPLTLGVDRAGGFGHAAFAIVLTVLGLVQMLSGVLRPLKAHPLRPAWRRFHQLSGVFSLALGGLVIVTGLLLLERYTAVYWPNLPLPLGVVCASVMLVGLVVIPINRIHNRPHLAGLPRLTLPKETRRRGVAKPSQVLVGH